MLPAERLLAGNSFIVLCLVTLIQPMKSRAVGVKISSYVTMHLN